MKKIGKKPAQIEEKEIDIVPLIKALASKLWLMALVGIIVAGVVFTATKLFIKPTYRCGFTVYVNNQQSKTNKDMLSNSDLIASQQLSKTFSLILRSNAILTASLKSINSDLSYEEFKNMVSTEVQDETELIDVYVVNQDPQKAFQLAEAIAKTAPSYMANIVEGSSMKIVDYPEYSNKRYKPNYVSFGLIGFVFGVLLILVIEIIRFFKDDSVRDESELEELFSVPVLGIIPDIRQAGSKSSSYYYNSSYGYGYDKPHEEKKEEKA